MQNPNRPLGLDHLSAAEYQSLRLYARRRILFHLRRITGCAECGATDKLAFVHVPSRGEQEFVINPAAACRSWEAILAELPKNEVHCLACRKGKPRNRRPMLRVYLDLGLPKKEIARRLGISRPTLYRWIAQLERPDG